MSSANSSEFSLDQYIQHHLADSYQWHLPFMPPVSLPFSLSVHGLMVILCAIFLIILFCCFYRRNDRVPRGFTNLLESFIMFIRDKIAVECLGEEEGRKMTPFLATMFFFILGLNLMGMIPIFSTATANINVTGALALVIFCVYVFGAMMHKGLKNFKKVIIPEGVPWLILIVIVPLEILTLFIRAFALMIRLGANMLSGHLVILVTLGFVILIGYAAVLPSILMALFISLLELFVAFLQAYIFTLLSSIFISLTFNPDH